MLLGFCSMVLDISLNFYNNAAVDFLAFFAIIPSNPLPV